MFGAIAFALFLGALLGFGQRLYKQQLSGGLHTFIVDPPTMLLVGFFGTALGLCTRKGRAMTAAEFRKRSRGITLGLTIFFVGFLCMEALSYFDLMAHPYDATKTGNDFMWNGYIDALGWAPFTFDRPTYLIWWTYPIVVAAVYVQWLCLKLGRALGYSVMGFDSKNENGTSHSS